MFKNLKITFENKHMNNKICFNKLYKGVTLFLYSKPRIHAVLKKLLNCNNYYNLSLNYLKIHSDC